MKKIGWFLFITLFFVGYAATGFAQESPTVTVAGFVNLGKPSDSTINIMITKSMITFLSKVSEGITPYEDVVKVAEANGFWSAKKLDSEKAILIAQTLGTERVIAGDYLVNEKEQTITINVSVFDVVTGKLSLQRNYTGPIGMDLFDTIDKMIRDVTGLVVGKTIVLQKLKVSVVNTTNSYTLYINDKEIKDIDAKAGFEDEFVVGRTVQAALKSKSSGKTVMTKSVEIQKDKASEIAYAPSGSVIAKVMLGECDIYVDGKFYSKTDKNGELTISDMTADKEFAIEAMKDGKSLDKKTAKLAEGETKALVLAEAKAARAIFFPVSVEYFMNLPNVQVGADYFILPEWKVSLSGGGAFGIITNLAGTTNYYLPILQLETGYYFLKPMDKLKIGINASAMFLIGDQFLVMPAVRLEAQYDMFFIRIGGVYEMQKGLFKIVAGGGVQF